MQEIAQFRSEAEIIRVQTGSYDTLCDNPGKGYDLWASAATRMETGPISFCLDSSGTSHREYSSPEVIDDITPTAEAEKWAASIKTGPAEYFCVDYTGFSGFLTTNPLGGADPDGADPRVADRECNL